jgi:hypothetical protein
MRSPSFILVLMAAAMAVASALVGQETPGGSHEGTEKVGGSPPYREQTIYVPYNKLRQIFEKEGRGVFVPYEEFQRLWRIAREAAKKPEAAKTPVASIIAEIESRATVSRDVMTVEAKLQIEVLREGWHYVFLRLKDAAVHSATIDGQAARLISETDKGYWVLVEKTGEEPEKVELQLVYSKAFTKQPGTNSVELEAPQAAVNRWEIRVPDADAKIKVEPNVSVSDQEMADKPEQDPDRQPAASDKETVVQAFVGVADKVRVQWTAKAEGAAGLAALVTVEARQEITVDEGVIHTRTTLMYDIQRADVTQLTIEVPSDHNIVNVFDPNIQRWEKKTEGPVQTITLALFQPTRGKQNVLIELEKFAGDKEMPQVMTHAEIRAPVVRAVQAGTADNMSNIGRQQGVVVARLGTSLRGEATSQTGLVQIDAAELPANLSRQNWQFAYRYAALPFDLVLSVEKLQPQIEAQQLVEVYLEPEQMTANLSAVLNIERAGVFQLELEVPEGYEVRRVQGRELGGATAAAVESHHLEDVSYVPDPDEPDVRAKKRTKLVVALSRRALGKIGLWAELVKRLDDPNLLQPTGTVSTLSLPLPRVAPASVNKSNGWVVVYAPESLRITPGEVSSLSPISPAEAVQTIGSSRGGRFAGLREVAAYAFAHEPASLSLAVERRKPHVEARELLTVHVEPGLVRYEATLIFDIKYSGVRSLAVELPAAIEGEVRNLTPALRDQRAAEQPAAEGGRVQWELRGEGELIGSVTAKFGWQKMLGELPVGTSVGIELPQIKPVGVDRFWGQIVASKAENIEISVQGEPTGLRPIDPQHDLMPHAAVTNAARAFEFHEDWSLALAATRYQLEEVKRTSIDRALVRMVATRSGQVAVQALYRLRSARQRVAIKLPGVDPKDTAGVLDARPLKINEQSVALEHDGTQFFIPLVGQATDTPVLVELRYTLEATPARLEVPEFPEDPAIQQVHLAVYLPDELRVLAVGGPWTDEQPAAIGRWPLFEVDADRQARKSPPSDEELLSRLREGLASCAMAGSDFPVDGKRRLYSTLRPESGARGALKLTAVHESTLNATVFLLVAVVGLALTARPLATRLWWMAGLLIGVVLLAVFAPALAEAVLRPPLLLAMGLVLVVWLLRALIALLPRGALAWRFAPAAGTSPFATAAEGGAAHE